MQRSGTDVAVTAATEAVVTLSGLTTETSYGFYAVLQDAAGNNGAVSQKVEITTLDATAPAFSAGPALDGSPTATSATLKFTASEAGKLFWVLYADGTDAPADAATLIAAASGSAGVQRSGTDVAVTAATEAVVTLSGLTTETSYGFYAVLQDSAGNNGAVSQKVEITTLDATAPAFSAGPALDGKPHGHQRHAEIHRQRGRGNSFGCSMPMAQTHQQTLPR